MRRSLKKSKNKVETNTQTSKIKLKFMGPKVSIGIRYNEKDTPQKKVNIKISNNSLDILKLIKSLYWW